MLISIGINDLPDKPTFLKILSIINAILDIYPKSSNKDKKKNKINICGTNPNIAPTPATIPSIIRLYNQSATFKLSKIPPIKLLT